MPTARGGPRRGAGPGRWPGDLAPLRAEHSSGSVGLGRGDVLASLLTLRARSGGRHVLPHRIRGSQSQGGRAHRRSEPPATQLTQPRRGQTALPPEAGRRVLNYSENGFALKFEYKEPFGMCQVASTVSQARAEESCVRLELRTRPRELTGKHRRATGQGRGPGRTCSASFPSLLG